MIKKALIFLFVLAVSAASAQALSIPDSAKFDQVMTMSSVDQPIVSTIYMKNKNIRVETQIAGKKMIMIMTNNGKAYMYDPDSHMAIAQDVPKIKDPSSGGLDYLSDPNLKLVGQETVDGRACNVYAYKGEMEGAKDIKTWVAKDIGFPVKTEVSTAQSKYTVEYKNIDLKANLADSLFQVPADAKVIEMGGMQEMLKGLISK